MDTKKNMGVIGTVVAVIVAVIGVSVVWASYSSNLKISGTATAEASNWSVKLADVSATATTGNSDPSGVTATAAEVTHPSISADGLTLENYSVKVKTPGDYISYTFKIKNEGTFKAKIGTVNMPTLSCTGSGANATADADNVCGNLTYTLTYNNGLLTDTVLDPAGTKEIEVTLKLQYAAGITADELPKSDVTITIPEYTIPITQA